MSNKLASLIGEQEVLGTTNEGRAWCEKALHPASSVEVKTGVPDFQTMPTMTQTFSFAYTLSAPGAANWEAEVLLHSNPWILGMGRCYDGVAATTFTPFYNTMLGASTTYGAAIRQYIYENIEAYRLVAAYMTIELDATSTTNSGTVSASQYILEPCLGTYDSASGPYVNVPAHVWKDVPKSYTTLVQMPGALVGKAEDGVYIPLRLDKNFPWRKTNERRFHINSAAAATYFAYNGQVCAIPAPAAADFPFGIDSTNSTPTWYHEFSNASPFVGHASFRNLNPAASLRVSVRHIYELMVPPSVNYASFLRAPCLPDPIALQMYSTIASRLKLAYPADYNHFGDILKEVWRIARTVLPVLFPITGPIMSGIDTTVSAARDIAASVKRGQPQAASSNAVQARRIRPKPKPSKLRIPKKK